MNLIEEEDLELKAFKLLSYLLRVNNEPSWVSFAAGNVLGLLFLVSLKSNQSLWKSFLNQLILMSTIAISFVCITDSKALSIVNEHQKTVMKSNDNQMQPVNDLLHYYKLERIYLSLLTLFRSHHSLVHRWSSSLCPVKYEHHNFICNRCRASNSSGAKREENKNK